MHNKINFEAEKIESFSSRDEMGEFYRITYLRKGYFPVSETKLTKDNEAPKATLKV